LFVDGRTNCAGRKLPPRPASVLRFGNVLQPQGQRTRIVLQNMSPTDTVTYSITITPHRAGCT